MYTNGMIVSIAEDTILTKLIWKKKSFGKTTSYNTISMIILNNYKTIMSLCIDNHNVIMQGSDRSVEKLASLDNILESKTS